MPTPKDSSARRGSRSTSSTGSTSGQSSDLGTTTSSSTPSSVTTGTTSSGDLSSSGYQSAGIPESSGSSSSDMGSQTESSGSGGGVRQFIRNTTYQQLGSQKQKAAEGLGSIAQAVRNSTDKLRESGQPAAADYANRAADQIERWTNSLRDSDLEDMIRELEQFARRQPTVFLGTAFGLGLLAARFLKSSGERSGAPYGGSAPMRGRYRYDERYSSQGFAGSSGTSSGYPSGSLGSQSTSSDLLGQPSPDISGTQSSSGGSTSTFGS